MFLSAARELCELARYNCGVPEHSALSKTRLRAIRSANFAARRLSNCLIPGDGSVPLEPVRQSSSSASLSRGFLPADYSRRRAGFAAKTTGCSRTGPAFPFGPLPTPRLCYRHLFLQPFRRVAHGQVHGDNVGDRAGDGGDRGEDCRQREGGCRREGHEALLGRLAHAGVREQLRTTGRTRS